MTREGEARQQGEQRRGAELRRHILMVAKNVFLETGYERASMDTVAARAETSKRSLYAHFESKDKLFLAVLGLVRELHLGQFQTPDAYADDPVEAVTLFCGRCLQLMAWEPGVRTSRLSIAAAERLPDSAKAYFDAMFASTYQRLSDYLAEQYAMDQAECMALAEDLLDRVVLPRLFRTLLGVEKPITSTPDKTALPQDVDLDAIRRLVWRNLPE